MDRFCRCRPRARRQLHATYQQGIGRIRAHPVDDIQPTPKGKESQHLKQLKRE